MKLPFLAKELENKWIAVRQKPREVVAWARSYGALSRKLKKNQKDQVVLLKVPKFEEQIKW